MRNVPRQRVSVALGVIDGDISLVFCDSNCHVLYEIHFLGYSLERFLNVW